jgi:hypothetical protein
MHGSAAKHDVLDASFPARGFYDHVVAISDAARHKSVDTLLNYSFPLPGEDISKVLLLSQK